MGVHDASKRRSSAVAIQQMVRKSQTKKKESATTRRSSVIKIQAVIRQHSSKKLLESKKEERRKRKTRKSIKMSGKQTNISPRHDNGDLTPRRENKVKESRRRGSALLIQKAWKTSSGRRITAARNSKIAVTDVPPFGSPKSGSPKASKYKLETGFKTKKRIDATQLPAKDQCLGPTKGGPSQILNNLWLGNREDALNYNIIKKLNITVVLNATEQLDNFHHDKGNITYLKINIKDKESTNLTPYFPQTTKFIADAIDNNENVLVHCVAGASRSASFVICYLMSHNGMRLSLLDAFSWCKARRSCVMPNKMFFVQLAQQEILFHEGGSSITKCKEKHWCSYELNELKRTKATSHISSGLNTGNSSVCALM